MYQVGADVLCYYSSSKPATSVVLEKTYSPRWMIVVYVIIMLSVCISLGGIALYLCRKFSTLHNFDPSEAKQQIEALR